MPKVRFIGDVHAKFDHYVEMTKDCDRSFQVGDFGLGFQQFSGQEVPYLSSAHQFIRGNHDDPAQCSKHPNWIPDGTVYDDMTMKMFFVGGALSTDQHLRTQGRDWWPDEELSIVELNDMIDRYDAIRPDIMVTHDCPFSLPIVGKYDRYKSRTSLAFDEMFSIHKPKLWVFGHYHQMYDKVILDTRFVCVDKNQFLDLDLD